MQQRLVRQVFMVLIFWTVSSRAQQNAKYQQNPTLVQHLQESGNHYTVVPLSTNSCFTQPGLRVLRGFPKDPHLRWHKAIPFSTTNAFSWLQKIHENPVRISLSLLSDCKVLGLLAKVWLKLFKADSVVLKSFSIFQISQPAQLGLCLCARHNQCNK